MKTNKTGFKTENIDTPARLVDMTDISARIQSEIDSLTRVLSEYEKRLALKQERIEQLEDNNVRLSSIEDKLDILIASGAKAAGKSEALVYEKKSELLDSIIEETKKLYDNLLMRTRRLEAREAELNIFGDKAAPKVAEKSDLPALRTYNIQEVKSPEKPLAYTAINPTAPELSLAAKPKLNYTYTFELPDSDDEANEPPKAETKSPEAPKPEAARPRIRSFAAATAEPALPDDGISLSQIDINKPIAQTLRARGISIPEPQKKSTETHYTAISELAASKEEPSSVAKASESKPVAKAAQPAPAPKRAATEPSRPLSRFSSLMSGNLEISASDLSDIARAVDMY